tara:strand:- start:6288 stop:7385 length:1098 start_codon:yes stop_codon:yes gene_type:complete
MKILITGAKGFIGKNFKIFLKQKNFKILTFDRNENLKKLHKNLFNCDLIFHFAGENRATNNKLFIKNNTNLTNEICNFLIEHNRKTPIIFTSTTKINKQSIYATTKKECEKILINYKKITNSNVSIYRFPNVFGKWSKSNYNSVVATFCHNISRKKKIKIYDKSEQINLLYIDDLVNQLYSIINSKKNVLYPKIKNIYKTKVSKIAKKIIGFQNNLDSIYIDDLKNKIDKNLFSTFISFIPRKSIFTRLKKNIDKRGNFIEYLKSERFGQVSIFTIKKNRERGGHYHNSKVEKFLIIKGKAKLIFKNVLSNKYFSKKVSGENLQIFHSVPGWMHTIKNVGNTDIVGIVWANEIFNKNKTDTYLVK